MDIGNLTTTEAIRAALGASSEEDLTDTDISNNTPELELELDLKSWLPDFDSIRDAGILTTATEAQKTAYQHLKMYAKYFCADLISRSANFSMPQMITDGQNEVQRFQENKWKELRESLRRRMAIHRTYLSDYAVSEFSRTEETTQYSLFGKATPSFNPVTGEQT